MTLSLSHSECDMEPPGSISHGVSYTERERERKEREREIETPLGKGPVLTYG